MRPIERLLQETALNTEGVEYYGRGPRSYANLDVSRYPRIWVHLINPIDTVFQNGLITVEYEVIGEVSGTVNLPQDIASSGDGSQAYLDTLELLQAVYFRFIGLLNKHPLNKAALGSVSRREILHDYDDNLAGYIFTFRISIREAVGYQC